MISVSNRNWKQKKINNRLAEKLKGVPLNVLL